MWFFILLSTLITVLFSYYKWSFDYWKRKNVNYIPPTFPFGNITNPFRRHENLGVTLQKIYEQIRSRKWKYGGIFFVFSPVYFVADLDSVKNVMAKDFSHFVDRGFYHNEKDDPLSGHLFAIGGPKWRRLRTKLTPTFTSGKMKMMFQTLVDCEENLMKKMNLEYTKKQPIDIKEILGCFTTDIIGSCAFGLECKTFEEDNSPFRVYGKEIFAGSLYRAIKTTITFNFPKIAKQLHIKSVPQDITKFFIKVVKDNVQFRETNNYRRNDFIQLLIDMKNDNSENDSPLSIEEVAAQCFVFFLAGFETSSTTMTFCLYELSKRPDIQEKVRKEITSVLAKYNGEITYEAIQDLKYMNQVIDETLRMYPPIPFLTRRCVKDYKIPDEDVIIEKGTMAMISVLGIHYDPELYYEPEKFDPERFTEENKQSRHHFAHIPFGEGPRLCIGMRFGLMQTKVGLTSLLRKYKFSVNSKTQEPLKMQVHSFVLAAEGEIWLNAQEI